jgi:hypothetical protein
MTGAVAFTSLASVAGGTRAARGDGGSYLRLHLVQREAPKLRLGETHALKFCPILTDGAMSC